MNVLLVNPPWRLDQSNVYSQTGAIFPPLGLASIAAVVKRAGRFPISVLDAWGLGMGIDRFREEIVRRSPAVLGITAYTTTVVPALAAAAEAKRASPGILVVMGGPHPTVMTDEILGRGGVDFVVRGEGEIAFPALLDRLASRRGDYGGVPGVSFKTDGEIRHNPGQSHVSDLDSIPWPNREDLPMPIYRPALGVYKRLPVASVITSRGCPFQCTFCSRSIFGNQVRYRSPEHVLGEVEQLIGQFGVREIYFADDCFTLDRERTRAICDLIVRKKLDLTWTCSTRVNLVDENLLRIMRKAGCVSIAYGVESADPEQLKAMKKGITLEQAQQVIKLTKKLGIEIRASYIFGMPGETRSSMEKTLSLAKKINADFTIFNLATPRPGTELYDEAKAQRLLLADGFDLYPLTDSSHPLIRLPEVSPEELMEFYRRAYRRYYFRFPYLVSRLRKVRSLEDVRHHWRGIREYIRWRRQSRPKISTDNSEG